MFAPGAMAWRCGRLNVASVLSVRASSMNSSGPPSPTQIVTIRPRESNVIEPQSPLRDAEDGCGDRPSGPRHV
jgi:hypothetical protein